MTVIPSSILILTILLFGSNVPNCTAQLGQVNGSDVIQSIDQIATYLKSIPHPPTPDDSYLTAPELIAKHGYPVEVHEVTTEDGYILTHHRIPFGKTGNSSLPRPPILVVHGLFSESTHWLYQPEDKCLPYLLANQGYDVWLANARGNNYSQAHISLSKNDPNFWRFGWNEMGNYDLPATIDYILANTGQFELHYIGHSMGTTMFFVMASLKPEYNAKIKLMIAYGPAVYMTHVSTPFRVVFPILGNRVVPTQNLLIDLGQGEFFPYNLTKYLTHYDAPFCVPYLLGDVTCAAIVFSIMGFDYAQMNNTMLPVIMSRLPSPTSTQAMIHYFQESTCASNGCFQKITYGPLDNWAKYKSLTPPSYDLSKITAPVVLFYGQNDYLATPTDVNNFAPKLPNLVANNRVNFDKWNHIDFLWGIQAKELLYDETIVYLSAYT